MKKKPRKPFDPEDPERKDLQNLLAREAAIVRAMPLTREALETIDALARNLYLALPIVSREEIVDVLDRISKLAVTAMVAAATDIRLTANRSKPRKSPGMTEH